MCRHSVEVGHFRQLLLQLLLRQQWQRHRWRRCRRLVVAAFARPVVVIKLVQRSPSWGHRLAVASLIGRPVAVSSLIGRPVVVSAAILALWRRQAGPARRRESVQGRGMHALRRRRPWWHAPAHAHGGPTEGARLRPARPRRRLPHGILLPHGIHDGHGHVLLGGPYPPSR